MSPDMPGRVITHTLLLVGMVALRWTMFAREPLAQPHATKQAVTVFITSLLAAALAALLFWALAEIGLEIHHDYGRGNEDVCAQTWLSWPIVSMHWATPGAAAAIDVGVGWFRFKANKRQLLPWATTASLALQAVSAVLLIQR